MARRGTKFRNVGDKAVFDKKIQKPDVKKLEIISKIFFGHPLGNFQTVKISKFVKTQSFSVAG
jgi:hypothetical protein